MQILKSLGLIYLVITCYILLLIHETSLSIINFLIPIIYLWILYFAFIFGTKSISNKFIASIPKFTGKSIFGLLSVKVVLLWISAIYLFGFLTIRFYTGSSFFAVINNLLNNSSTYSLYQAHLMESQVGESLKRIPYSLMLAFLYISLIYSTIILFYSQQLNRKALSIWISASIVTISFGLARGTSFEIFQWIILIIYAYSITKSKLNFRFLLFCIVAFIGFIFFIVSNLENRGYVISQFPIPSIIINDDAIILNSSVFKYITIYVFGYLGYGLYYSSIFFSKIMFTSIANISSLLFPFGYQVLHNSSFIPHTNALAQLGVNWCPDFIRFINPIGIIGVVLLCYIMGKGFAFFCKNRNSYSALALGYLIFLEMLSLPIGKFIANSSSNKISLIFFLICQFFYIDKNLIILRK